MEADSGKFTYLPPIPQRGRWLMLDIQNMVFAKDEAKFKIKQLQHKATGGLGGREPGVETEV